MASESIKLSSPETREFWEISVLYEDEHLLAVDKPSKLLTSPDRYDPKRPNLMKLLHAGIERGTPWAKSRGLTYLMNAHRLDFETSGVILLAKDKPMLVAVANLFGSEKPVKTYSALVQRSPEEKSFEVDAKLAPHPVKLGLIRVDEKNGKRSRTQFELVEKFAGYSLLKCRPLSGRQHQIRVHLQYAGLPIVGDSLYGGQPLMLSSLKRDYRLKPNKTERPLLDRVSLHAEELSLVHPLTNAEIKIVAPWPKDLKVAVKYLRLYAAAAF
ncbi:RluA family pseudouridine synthase [Pedosphaera parvula]|uniref:Pseudouridine synthase n=1 Tax=Pedosphaera parvula (strain Ellin514) TaxID=320771 RepID=B9XQ50_PEDPL|nr:RluA family pseudouridine synthase [Pedosphaera parvula]EEF58054.1 pseudouridine synthase [Pedosphaera parvula Ellin514]